MSDNQKILDTLQKNIKKGNLVPYLHQLKSNYQEQKKVNNIPEKDYTIHFVMDILKYLVHSQDKPLHNKQNLLAAFQMVNNHFKANIYEPYLKNTEKFLITDLPEELKNDPDLFKQIFAINGKATSLQYSSWKLRNNKEFMHSLVPQYTGIYACANKLIKQDHTFFKEALKKDLLIMNHAPESIQDDEALVKLSIQYHPVNLSYASVRFSSKKEWILPILQTDLTHYGAFTTLHDDFDITLQAVQFKGTLLSYSSNNLKNNTTIVLAALKNTSDALLFAGEDILKNYPSAIKYKTELKKNTNINNNIYIQKKLAQQYTPGLINEIIQDQIQKETKNLHETIHEENNRELDLIKSFIAELNLTTQFEEYKSNQKKKIIKIL